MSIAKLNLSESAVLDFGVNITGSDGRPDARFIIEGKDFSVSFPCKQTTEGVEVEIKGLQNIFKAGEYTAKLEIVLENKIYTPVIDKIIFEPAITITTESKVKTIKEEVKVANVKVTKKPIVEEKALTESQIKALTDLVSEWADIAPMYSQDVMQESSMETISKVSNKLATNIFKSLDEDVTKRPVTYSKLVEKLTSKVRDIETAYLKDKQ